MHGEHGVSSEDDAGLKILESDVATYVPSSLSLPDRGPAGASQ